MSAANVLLTLYHEQSTNTEVYDYLSLHFFSKRLLFTDSSYSVASSPTCQFIVGPEKRVYLVHAGLIAHHSPVLQLIMEDLNEPVKWAFLWDSVDEAIFLSLWQFLYTGTYSFGPTPAERPLTPRDYSGGRDSCYTPYSHHHGSDSPDNTPPASLILQFRQVDPEMPSIEARFSWEDECVFGQPSIRRWANKGQMWNNFKQLRLENDLVLKGTQKCQYGHEGLTHAQTFIHHAKVYMLAEEYQFTQLMCVSLKKLHKALADFDLESRTCDGPVELMQICFTGSSPEKLKDLLVHYAAINVRVLWMNENFRGLVKGSGDFSESLMGYVLDRLD